MAMSVAFVLMITDGQDTQKRAEDLQQAGNAIGPAWCAAQTRYSSSVTCSAHSVMPSLTARWTMNVPRAAPCQCHSPGAAVTASPARTSSRTPPRDWTRPAPSVTCST